METPESRYMDAFLRIAGKSFADYLGFPSFWEYLERTCWFRANLTTGEIEEKHLTGVLFGAPGLEEENSYDGFVEKLLSEESELSGFFDKEKLVSIYNGGEDFACGDGDIETESGTIRILASCELDSEKGEVRGLFVLSDVSGLYDSHMLARKYAEYDPLTELLSRHAADVYGKEYLSTHPDEDAVMVLLEVDHFKDLNDMYGHHIGDIILKTIAKELTSFFGHEAIIARNGGQEFIVMLKDVDPEEAEERIQVFSEAEHHVESEGSTYPYTFSVGYCFYPTQGILYHDLARKADKAKYNIKLGGGNSCCKFASEMMELNNF